MAAKPRSDSMTPEMRKAVWTKAFSAKPNPSNTITTKSKLTDSRPTKQNPPDHTKPKPTPPVSSDPHHSGNPRLDNFIEEVLQTVETRTATTSETPETTGNQTSQSQQDEILKSIFGQIQTLFNDLSSHIKQTPLASFVPELQSTLNKMDAFLQNGNKSFPTVASTHRSYAQAVTANDDTDFELVQNPKKRHRSTLSPQATSPSETTRKSNTTPPPIIIDNINRTVFQTAKDIAKEIMRCKPSVSLYKLVNLQRGGLLVYPKDPKSMNQLLAPWPEKAFQSPNLSVKLSNHQSRSETQQNNRQIIIKGLSLSITTDQIKEELKNQDIDISRINRIISKKTETPTTFIRITLNNPADATKLLREGFFMDFFHYRTEKAHTAPNIKQCFNCQEFNHVAQQCKNKTKCVRCGGEHSHKTCDKAKHEPKCANCGGNHSAASKHCPTYLSQIRPTKTVSQPPSQLHPDPKTSRPLTQRTTPQDDLKTLCQDGKQFEAIWRCLEKHFQ